MNKNILLLWLNVNYVVLFQVLLYINHGKYILFHVGGSLVHLYSLRTIYIDQSDFAFLARFRNPNCDFDKNSSAKLV